MKVNSQNQICFIRDAPEHPIKSLLQTAPVANLASSMLARWASSAFIDAIQAQLLTHAQSMLHSPHTGAAACDSKGV